MANDHKNDNQDNNKDNGKRDRPRNNDSDNQDDKDEALWQIITRNVKPLAGRPKAKPRPPIRTQQTTTAITETISPEKTGSVAPQTKSATSLTSGLDRQTDKKLKSGKFKIEGRLDMHGMSRTEAQGTLIPFLHEAYHSGKRCVLIITGKGQRNTGILKMALPSWLADNAVADIVLKFYPAQPKDGGDGAFYVLLRRNRQL